MKLSGSPHPKPVRRPSLTNPKPEEPQEKPIKPLDSCKPPGAPTEAPTCGQPPQTSTGPPNSGQPPRITLSSDEEPHKVMIYNLVRSVMLCHIMYLAQICDHTYGRSK